MSKLIFNHYKEVWRLHNMSLPSLRWQILNPHNLSPRWQFILLCQTVSLYVVTLTQLPCRTAIQQGSVYSQSISNQDNKDRHTDCYLVVHQSSRQIFLKRHNGQARATQTHTAALWSNRQQFSQNGYQLLARPKQMVGHCKLVTVPGSASATHTDTAILWYSSPTGN